MAFWQLTVPVSAEISDALTNFLWEQGALGVVEEESPAEPARLRAFFPDTTSSTALLRAVGTYRSSLRRLGFPVTSVEPDIAPLVEEAWASAWQQSFPPLPVGRRLLIIPPWLCEAHPRECEPQPKARRAMGVEEARSAPSRADTGDGRVPVVIEPGRAFGTGHHGSTEGCLALLEEALAARPAPRVLDIGTGTGILAVAAVKLGAGAVLALDVDPDAVAAAMRNTQRNGCEERITLRLEGPEDLIGEEPFPLVLANLLGHTHLALRPHYERLVAAAGRLILGGLLADEDAGVIRALASSRFILATRVVKDGWSSLLLDARRP